MRAMLLDAPGGPLRLAQVPDPVPGPGQVLLRVAACAVCRTDLHVVDGELAHPKLPLIPGHEIVGLVAAWGEGVEGFAVGDRVGVPWLGWTCGACGYCRSGRENLCPDARFTGYTLDGGYAEQAVADARYCFRIPAGYTDAQAAPLLCAGLIGYRSLRMAGEGERLGIYGFGAAAHIVAQVARHQGRRVFAFTRPGDDEAQRFAWELGAVWTGGSDERPPEELDAAILFAPVGALVPAAPRELSMSSLPHAAKWGTMASTMAGARAARDYRRHESDAHHAQRLRDRRDPGRHRQRVPRVQPQVIHAWTDGQRRLRGRGGGADGLGVRGLGHHLDDPRMNRRGRTGAGAVHDGGLAHRVTQKSLGHLAARRVARAEKEDIVGAAAHATLNPLGTQHALSAAL